MENLSMVWVLLALLFLMEFMYLKQAYAMGRERRLHAEQLKRHTEEMKLFGKIAYHHGFIDGGMWTGYDYDREYPKIKERFKERWEEKD